MKVEDLKKLPHFPKNEQKKSSFLCPFFEKTKKHKNQKKGTFLEENIMVLHHPIVDTNGKFTIFDKIFVRDI